MSTPRSTALIVDASKSVATLLGSYVRLAVGTETELAHDFKTLKKLLEDRPERFYVAALDTVLPDAPSGEAVDYVLGYNIPVIVLTASHGDAQHEAVVDKNVVEFVVKSGTGEMEYATNAIHRVYNNRFVKILIVDDSISYRYYLRNLLRMHQYQTLDAANADQALATLDENNDIRLVIVDYNMPGINGLQLINVIRQRYNRSELAVLGLSQVDDEKLPARILRSGANDFVTKPVVVEEFYCRVTHCIETIEHIRLIEEWATRDYLTRAYNRRYLFEAGSRLHENAKRGNLTLAAAMIDADHFKSINDKHGHHVGDVVLKAIASTLAECLRQSDLVARVGGEEFCVLATGLDEAGAANVFERVRQEIDALDISADERTVHVTVSIGVCMTLEDSLESMINRADGALYSAKSQGRNKVVLVTENA
ncbi:MAG: diguanylate cyclase [Gammaproteobacteria bacterium]|nr:diguanylate cyclase [Gammaproteobacteria bacterium]